MRVFIASQEDTLVSKLEWAKHGGGSELQLRDAAGILELRSDQLDIAYVEHWVGELGLEDLWERIRHAVGIRE